MIHTPSRRGLRRRVIAAMGTAVAAALLLAGCATGGGPAGKDSAATRNFGADQSFDLPPKGNFHTLAGVTGSIPTNLGYLNDMIMLPGGIYNWEKQEYYHLLADESSTVSDDGLTFTYKVRQGLKWSDGSPLTAKDVHHSFAMRYVMQQPVFNYLEDITVVDDSTLEFRLLEPTPIAVYWIMRERPASSAQYGEVVEDAVTLFEARTPADSPEAKALAARIAEVRIDAPIVSGPFTIDTSTMTNSQLTLTLNEHGYRADSVGYDTITVHSGSTETITPLVLSGDVHYATDGFPVATAKQFEQQGYRILRPPTYTGPALFFNYSRLPEFQDKRVRQAFGFFLNRDEMGTLSLGDSGKGVRYMTGLSDNAIETWVTPEAAAGLTAYDLDLERATQLLEEAGWSKSGDQWITSAGTPAQYDLIFPADYVDWAATGQSLAEQANAFGIRITPVGVDSSQQEVDVQEGNFQLAIQAWGASNPFPTDSYNATLINFNHPKLGEGKGMGFDLQVETDVLGPMDLEQEVTDSAFGRPEEQVAKTTRLAQAFNELLPVLPLVERFGNNPVVTSEVSGFPEESDLYMNSFYSDNFVPVFFYEGMLSPTR
ncbi:ABC transporter substrate-binding protein [Arachnia propionica]|nr:ABC transporter substrate-binding protein [Arachnia propionica]